MEALFIIAGVIMLYCTGHFLIIQYRKSNSERTTYQKVVSVIGIVSIVLVFLGTMFGK